MATAMLDETVEHRHITWIIPEKGHYTIGSCFENVRKRMR
jgi:hypothetical protein